MYMERENNRMTAESQNFTRETNQLSYKMAELNQDIYRLNRTSTHAAVETGRITRTNVQVSICRYPLVTAERK